MDDPPPLVELNKRANALLELLAASNASPSSTGSDACTGGAPSSKAGGAAIRGGGKDNFVAGAGADNGGSASAGAGPGNGDASSSRSGGSGSHDAAAHAGADADAAAAAESVWQRAGYQRGGAVGQTISEYMKW